MHQALAMANNLVRNDIYLPAPNFVAGDLDPIRAGKRGAFAHALTLAGKPGWIAIPSIASVISENRRAERNSASGSAA